MASERTCNGCRWFVRNNGGDDTRRYLLPGQCRRYPPALDNDDGFPGVSEQEFCGEWADGRLTAEQAERQQRVKEFALAIVQGLFANPEGDMVDVMTESQRIANEWQSQMEGQ